MRVCVLLRADDIPEFFETVALPWARAAAADDNVAVNDAVLRHNAVENEQAAHGKANKSWTKTANYKRKPEAKGKSKQLVNA